MKYSRVKKCLQQISDKIITSDNEALEECEYLGYIKESENDGYSYALTPVGKKQLSGTRCAKYKLEGEWIDPDKIDELSNEDLDEMIEDQEVIGEIAEKEQFLKDLFGMGGEKE